MTWNERVILSLRRIRWSVGSGTGTSDPSQAQDDIPFIAAGVLLFAAAFAIYVATRSISLDDFDSFNFARAIDLFDIRLNQPHAPGYPVYVILARLVDWFTHDHLSALTLLSAVSGALTILVFFAIGRKLGAPWAAALLATMPLFWLSSEIALSDVPGLFFASLAVLLFLHAGQTCALKSAGPRRNTVLLSAAGVVTGLSAGVRPQDALIPLSVGIIYAGPVLLRQRQWMGIAAALLAFIAGSLAWAIPLARSFDNLSQAVSAFTGQGAYVGATDSLLARPLTLPNLAARLAEFGDVFSGYFGGPPNGGLPAFIGLVVGGTLVSVLCRHREARRLALAWLLPYAIFMLVTLRPDDPRKVLPVVPPLLLLFAGAVAPASSRGLANGKRTGSAVTLAWALAPLALSLFFLSKAWPLVHTLDTVKAPPVQATDYISSHFQPRDTLIVAGLSYNAIHDTLPGYPTYFLEALDLKSFNRDLGSGAYRHVILLDKEGPPIPDTYVGADTMTFRRDPLVLPKASEVWMAVYQPLDTLTPQQFALPNGPVHIGTREDVRYVGEGWWRPETIAGIPARWTSAESSLRFWIGRPTASNLGLVAVSFPAKQQLTVLLNDQPVTTLSVGQDWGPYNISIPAALFRAEAINTITLKHSQAVSASEATHGQSTDTRALAVAYSVFELRPQ